MRGVIHQNRRDRPHRRLPDTPPVGPYQPLVSRHRGVHTPERIRREAEGNASGGNDRPVKVWDARTGQRLVLYTGHLGTVDTLTWSPDGTRIASGSDDSTVQVWDARSGRLLLTYRGHPSGVRALAWSPDGRRLVSGSNDNTIQVWNATTGKRGVSYTRHQAAPLSE